MILPLADDADAPSWQTTAQMASGGIVGTDEFDEFIALLGVGERQSQKRGVEPKGNTLTKYFPRKSA